MEPFYKAACLVLAAEKNLLKDCREKKGYVAISTTSLQGRLLNNRSCYAWLKKYEPIKKVGYTIFVYNITDFRH